MANIITAGSLIPGTVDTPLDARARIAALSNVANIENPYAGMIFYVTATGKHYVVKTLKNKLIGGVTVANAAIDTYEAVPDKADIDGKAPINHTHEGLASESGEPCIVTGAPDPATKKITVQPVNVNADGSTTPKGNPVQCFYTFGGD